MANGPKEKVELFMGRFNYHHHIIINLKFREDNFETNSVSQEESKCYISCFKKAEYIFELVSNIVIPKSYTNYNS